MLRECGDRLFFDGVSRGIHVVEWFSEGKDSRPGYQSEKGWPAGVSAYCAPGPVQVPACSSSISAVSAMLDIDFPSDVVVDER